MPPRGRTPSKQQPSSVSSPSKSSSSTPAKYAEGVPIPNKTEVVPKLVGKFQEPPAIEARFDPISTPMWVVIWLVISSAIVLMDAGYILLRPYSLAAPVGDAAGAYTGPDYEGIGTYASYWPDYNSQNGFASSRIGFSYAELDKLYSIEGYAAYLAGQEGFNWGQSVLNIFEVALTAIFFFMVYNNYHSANVVGMTASLFTAYKTIIYFVIEVGTGNHNSKQNHSDTFRTAFYYGVNGIWIVVPLIVAITLGSIVVRRIGPKA